MRVAKTKICPSGIDIFVALYAVDRTYLRLSPIVNYHVEVAGEKGQMYPYNRIHTDCVYKFVKIARNLLLGVLSSDINKSVSIFKY